MGGYGRKPFVVPKVKQEIPKTPKQPERPPNVAPTWVDFEELAFPKRKPKQPK